MIVRQYVKDFENMGLGMFVHFGVYSILGRGGEIVVSAEWLDDSTPLHIETREGKTVIKTMPYLYGKNYVVRVAKIWVKNPS